MSDWIRSEPDSVSQAYLNLEYLTEYCSHEHLKRMRVLA